MDVNRHGAFTLSGTRIELGHWRVGLLSVIFPLPFVSLSLLSLAPSFSATMLLKALCGSIAVLPPVRSVITPSLFRTMASNSPTLPPGTIPFSLISTLQEEYQKHQVAPFEPGQTTWEKYARRNSLPKSFSPSSRWNDRISLFEGDITKLKTDAIVNAANEALAGGGGVDGAIHAAAGPELSEECRTLNRCPTGQAKITKGYHLPSKHVIHTVGPRVIDPKALMSCYYESLELMRINNLKSIVSYSITDFLSPQDLSRIGAYSHPP